MEYVILIISLLLIHACLLWYQISASSDNLPGRWYMTVLYCNVKKCEFDKKKIEFLGVNVSQDGFEMEDKKIADVLDWQRPMSV